MQDLTPLDSLDSLELTDEDIRKIADTYHAWRGGAGLPYPYHDIPGFCKSATLKLTPGRYAGAVVKGDDEVVGEQDGAARGPVARSTRGSGATGCGDRGQPEGAGVLIHPERLLSLSCQCENSVRRYFQSRQ